jgi:3',5'-nucleoside bisphosphate phosphatase
VDGKADLHIHTTYSDGALSPGELFDRVRDAELCAISITDHDSVGGLKDAIEWGKTTGVDVIPGVELSAAIDGSEVHILGYFIDYENKNLLEALAAFREERLRRAERIVGKLNRMNIPLSMDAVLATTTGDSVGRPHIASALVSEGHAETYHQAFNKYIGNGRPAYEQKITFSPEETIQLIALAGGLSFVAHPGRIIGEDLLIHLIQSGLDGIEVIHPSHSSDLVSYYRGIVNEYCLLESGGSDFHGGQRGDDSALGKIVIDSSIIDIMRRRLLTGESNISN